MANLPESNVWEDGIYQLEETDPVQGGPSGIDNRQAKELANRTVFLKALVDTLGTGKLDLSALSSQAEAEAGANNTKWMTPQRVAQAVAALVVAATETVSGKVELATAAETVTGTDTQRATHPAGVKSAISAAIAALVNSSPSTLDTLNELATALGNDPNFATTIATALGGKVDQSALATQAQAEAGTNNTQWMTPLRVAQAIDAMTQAAQIMSAVRQTVLSGPLDASGYSAFGGAPGSTTVSPAATLIVTAANGFNATGQVDRIGSITNPNWPGLNTNGTIFLYLDVAADGTCTPGSTTLEPVYQFGGAYSATNGQHTFNAQEMKMKVGNGSAAVQVNRVFVGEVTVAGGVVTAITWYGLMGRYDSGLFSATTSTTYSKSHNLGTRQFVLEVTIADDANGTNERPATSLYNTTLTAARGIFAGASSRNAAAIVTSSGSVGMNTSGGDVSTAYFRIRARRAF